MAYSGVGLRGGVLGAVLRPGRRRSRATIKVGLRDDRLGVQLAAGGAVLGWGHDVVGGVAWGLDFADRKDGERPRLRGVGACTIGGVGAWASSEREAFQVGGASHEIPLSSH